MKKTQNRNTQRNRSSSCDQLREDPGFRCRHCGHFAPGGGGGTRHRNHCPACLHSVHLDIDPGDRSAGCGGLMEPIAVWVRGSGEWQIIHRCIACGELDSNRVASDDSELLLISLAARPMARPPFPLEAILNRLS